MDARTIPVVQLDSPFKYLFRMNEIVLGELCPKRHNSVRVRRCGCVSLRTTGELHNA
jgi:hypothetical protein